MTMEKNMKTKRKILTLREINTILRRKGKHAKDKANRHRKHNRTRR